MIQKKSYFSISTLLLSLLMAIRLYADPSPSQPSQRRPDGDLILLKSGDRLSGLILEQRADSVLLQAAHGLYRIHAELLQETLYNPRVLRRLLFARSTTLYQVREVRSGTIRGNPPDEGCVRADNSLDPGCGAKVPFAPPLTWSSVRSIRWIPGKQSGIPSDSGREGAKKGEDTMDDANPESGQSLLLENGDRISGRIQRITGDTILMETPYGIYRIKREFLSRILMAKPARAFVKKKEGGYIKGTMVSADPRGVVIQKDPPPGSPDEEEKTPATETATPATESGEESGPSKTLLLPFSSIFELLFPDS